MTSLTVNEIKGLSLTQPWAQLVVLGQKLWETRSWQTKHRGTIAIHASKGMPGKAKRLCQHHPMFFSVLGACWMKPLPLGAIVGTVVVVDCFRVEDVRETLLTKELAFGDYSDGRWAWQLRAPRMLAEPIACSGALKLWTLPEDVVERLTGVTLPMGV